MPVYVVIILKVRKWHFYDVLFYACVREVDWLFGAKCSNQ